MTYTLKNNFAAAFAAIVSAAVLVSFSVAPAVNTASTLVI